MNYGWHLRSALNDLEFDFIQRLALAERALADFYAHPELHNDGGVKHLELRNERDLLKSACEELAELLE